MKNAKLVKLALSLSGVTAIAIGGAILLVPAAFYATYGIELGSDANLGSDIRASGGALLTTGLLMLAGLVVPRFTFASIVIAAAVFLSYGLSRLAGVAMDGWPDSGLIWAGAFELAIAVVSLLALSRYRTIA